MANRSQPVAPGGMWSPAKGSYSKQTSDLLKQMMNESKLTNFQQRQLSKSIHEGGSFPVECNPTSSAKPRQKPQPRPQSKVIDPRQRSGTIRTKEAIEATGAYKREAYVPLPQTFYEKDKERLVNMMAYGEDVAPPEKPKIVREPERDPLEIDRFDELQAEVEERQKFLADMEKIGQGAKYRNIIATEVSQKVREMEQIDKKRTAELEKMIARQEQKNVIKGQINVS